MSSGRQKQQAVTRKGSTAKSTNIRGRGSNSREVESPLKVAKGKRLNSEDEDNAREVALAEARSDAQAEREAVDNDTEKTPPPEIFVRLEGPAAAIADRQKALGRKEANDKAAEAEKRADKLRAELELTKTQLQKEKKKRKIEEEVPISKPRRSSTSVVSSRKKAVSTVNYVIKLECLTIILCVQKMEGNDKLVALLADQVVSRFIHGKVVNRLVTLLGLRWSSSLHRQQCSPIVQSIVVQGKLGGIDTDAKYISLKATGLKGDFHMLQQLQYAHNKTAKNHRDKVRTLVAALFDESFDDPILDAIKLDLFGVEDGGRIVPRDHPTLQQMRALPPPLHKGMHPSDPTRALSACAHVTLRARALRQVTRGARALRRVTPHARALSRETRR